MLYLVVGPSGVGKDTLLDALKEHFTTDAVYFPHRHITRPADAGGEDHVPETVESFAEKKAAGAFCLTWHAHGLDYGVPCDVLDALNAGRTVFVNVSRTVIGDAQKLTDRVCVLEFNASPDIIRTRLQHRGRETPEEIEERIARAVSFSIPPGVQHIRILNDGTVAETLATMIGKLRIET